MIQLTWQAGLSKPLGIPKSSAEVTEEDVEVRQKLSGVCDSALGAAFST